MKVSPCHSQRWHSGRFCWLSLLAAAVLGVIHFGAECSRSAPLEAKDASAN